MAVQQIRHAMKNFDCVNCNERLSANWYMRHVNKCVVGKPNAKQLINKASEIYIKGMSEGDENMQTNISEFLVEDFAKTLNISTKTLSRYKLLLEEKGFEFPKIKDMAYKRRIEYTPDVINLFTDLVEMKSQFPLEEAAEKVVAKHKQGEQLTIPLPVTPLDETSTTKKNNIDQVVYETTEEAKALLTDIAPKYKTGDIIEGTVTSIEYYGIFVNQGLYVKGMIHKSNVMKHTDNPDLHAYFKVGDLVKAEVIAVKPNGKLNLSTKNMNLKPINDEHPFAKLAEIKLESDVENVNVASTPPPLILDKNLGEIIEFIKTKVGIVSPAARELIADLYRKHGMLSFSMSLGVASASFEVDLGLALVREVEKQLDDSL